MCSPLTSCSSKLSDKDKEDAKFAVEMKLDYICLSFVQTADDVYELRDFMKYVVILSLMFSIDSICRACAPDGQKEQNPSKIQKHTSWATTLPLIICKIEKPQAGNYSCLRNSTFLYVIVDNIQSILEATDGIMVARGDLGVELSLERVPAVQKMLIEACNAIQKVHDPIFTT